MNLNPISIIPDNEEAWLKLRLEDVTSTSVPALFGISPYLTEFELWHRLKSRQIVEIDMNERVTWGKRLEPAIAAGIAEDKGWKIRAKKEYMRVEALRIGSSFDFEILGKDSAILEIKNVDSLQFDRTWIDEGEGIVGPNHIELQVQVQLLVSGLSKAYIGVLIGGNRLEVLERERNEAIIDKILKRVKVFWDSIDLNSPPVPNFERDAAFIASLYRITDPGLVMEADEEITEWAQGYIEKGKIVNSLISEREGLKAKLLTKIDKAEKVYGEGFTISAAQVKESIVKEYVREARRDFRIIPKKARPE